LNSFRDFSAESIRKKFVAFFEDQRVCAPGYKINSNKPPVKKQPKI
jgi:hypothetical protein